MLILLFILMLTLSPKLRIAVLGAGRIGTACAFQLASIGGHEVTVIARPGSLRLEQLQRDGAIVNDKGAKAEVQISSALDESIAYDLVLVTLLAHQVDGLLPTLQRSAAKCFQFMFNTFNPERLQEAIGHERCSLGMPFIQATFTPNGRLKATIGAGGQKTIMSQQHWVDVFNSSGLPAALEHDMALWLRCHVPLCVAFESISVAGERRSGGASWKEAFVIAQGLRESFLLLKGLGYSIYPNAKKRVSGSPIWALASILWFMSRIRSFRTLLATGKDECCALVDVMVAAAPLAKNSVHVGTILAMKPFSE